MTITKNEPTAWLSKLLCLAILVSAVLNGEGPLSATLSPLSFGGGELTWPAWLFALQYWLIVLGTVGILFGISVGYWSLIVGAILHWKIGFVWIYLPFVSVSVEDESTRLLAIGAINTIVAILIAIPYLRELVTRRSIVAANGES